MTLRNFIDGGYDVTDVRILVVVKSIGPKKRSMSSDDLSILVPANAVSIKSLARTNL